MPKAPVDVNSQAEAAAVGRARQEAAATTVTIRHEATAILPKSTGFMDLGSRMVVRGQDAILSSHNKPEPRMSVWQRE